MSEYERLMQDRRDADRARNNDWKARALKAEARVADLEGWNTELAAVGRQIGIEQFEANAARIKAEADLRYHDEKAMEAHAARLKAEEAMRLALTALDQADDLNVGGDAIPVAKHYLRAALSEKGG